MATERSDDAGSPAPGATESDRALLDRVAASPDLRRSPRLRQLFVYLCDKSLTDPGAPLSEEQIGVEVFGRRRGYDTGTDTLVRVQVSQLRKKIEHYFLSEGAAEPVIIELPKRSYTPVFRPRGHAPPEDERLARVKSSPRWLTISLALAVLLSVCLAAALLLLDRPSLTPSRTPFRDHFWSQLFRGGRQTQVVASDANVMTLADFLGRPVTPAEYVGSGYPAGLIDAHVPDPAVRRILKGIASNYVANMPDLRVTNQLSLIAAASGGRLNIVYARDFRYQPQTPDNLIFLSHKKANPWVALFEERMNFRYAWDFEKSQASIVNLAPKPGEEPKYSVDWGVQTYAVIAHLRKPVGEGTILLLEGADTGAVEAGCNLLTDETRIKSLYDRLGISRTAPIPDFEILLRAKLLRSFVRDYEMVAHRIISR